MKKLSAIVAILCVIFAGVWVVPVVGEEDEESMEAQNTQRSLKRNTLYVGSGQTYSKIQDAVDNASVGDTIRVLAGTYNEWVMIDKQLKLIGDGFENTTINAGQLGSPIYVKADHCIIDGFNVIGYPKDTGTAGIAVRSNFNQIKNITTTQWWYSIISIYGDNNTISNSEFIGPDREYGIRLIDAKDNIIENCVFKQNGVGIEILYSKRNEVRNCDFVYKSSIEIYGSNYIQIHDSNFSKGNVGITIGWDVYNCEIVNCTLIENTFTGIFIGRGTKYDIIRNSSFILNGEYGIFIQNDTNDETEDCNINNNIFIGNKKAAIELSPSTKNNLIYNNTFINNGLENPNHNKQVLDQTSNNKWDNGSIGNYWNDWLSPDNDSNGIVDKPYIINKTTGAKDNYPLIQPIKMLNLYPTIVNKNYFISYAGELYSVNYIATDPDTPQNQLTWNMNTNASWLNFSSKQKLFGTPYSSNIGFYWVNISVSDGINSDWTNFTLTVRPSFGPGYGTVIIKRTGQKFSKIQNAIDNASYGDTIRAYDGKYYENIVINKTISLVGNGSANTLIHGRSLGDVMVVKAKNCNISGFNITGGDYGSSDLKTWGAGINVVSDNCNISNITSCFNNGWGIFINNSHKNIISNCICVYNSLHGINLSYSEYNQIMNCESSYNDFGIWTTWSDYNIIDNNSCNYNKVAGINIHYFCSDSKVYNNQMNYNVKYGLTQNRSGGNEISHNLFMNNIEYGIYSDEGAGNLIHLNDFINNNNGGTQAFAFFNYAKWNGLEKGNYWSDWIKPDKDNDGIVDQPYNISGSSGAKDYYPLVNPLRNISFIPKYNKPPTIITQNVLTAYVGKLYLVNYTASDQDTPQKQLIWTMKTNASWLNFSSGQQLLGTPSSLDVGIYWINISVSDGNNSDWTNFTLIVKIATKPPLTNKGRVINERTGQKYIKIQDAIDNASSGDTIRIWAGYYKENIVIRKKLELIGNGSSNTIINGSKIGPVITLYADGCNISNLYVTHYRHTGYVCEGIHIYSDNNEIKDCLLYRNNKGIVINSSNNNIIKSCIIKSNHYSGIFIFAFFNNSENNLIIYNNFISNGGVGINFFNNDVVYNSKNNLVHHNNFINNTINSQFFKYQASDDGFYNKWNTDTEGNYWSDWTTPDKNNDGIVDKPYDIFGNGNAKDYYPLTKIVEIPNGNNIIPDIKEPTIIFISPEFNSDNFSVNNSEAVITFSTPMNTSSVEASLEISPYVNYILAWEKNNTILRIIFSEDLTYNTNYSITIGTAAKDVWDNKLNSELEFVFKTEEEEDRDRKDKPEDGGMFIVYIAITIVIIIILFLIILALITRTQRKRYKDIEKSKEKHEGLITTNGFNEVIYELKQKALAPYKPSDFALTRSEILAKFEKKYQDGKISEKTFDTIKGSLSDKKP